MSTSWDIPDFSDRFERLFVTATNENDNALLRHSAGDFDAYAYAYEKSAEQLVEAVPRGCPRWDFVGLTLVYLCRHALELRMKHLIELLQPTSSVKPAARPDHDLVAIWSTLRPQLEIAYRHQGDLSKLDSAERQIHELHAFDSRSTALRYPFDRSGQQSVSRQIEFDPQHFYAAVSGLLGFLSGIRDDLSYRP